MTFDRSQLVELIRRDALEFGDFTLASGQKSSFYLDCRKVTLLSSGAALIGAGVLDAIAGDACDAVGGLTLGADPVVAATLTIAGLRGVPLRGFLVRKQAKEHGTGKLIEGPLRSGDRVVIVEDVTTTGSSAVAAIEAAQNAGCIVARVVTVLDRLAGAEKAFASKGIAFSALTTIRDLGLT